MKKIIQKTIFISLLFAGTSLWAQDTIDITDLEGAKISIYDSKYIIGSTTTTYSGTYVLTGEYSLNSSSKNYILIYSGNYTDNTFTLDNLKITNTSTYTVGSNDDFIKIKLVGNNILSSGRQGLNLYNTSCILLGDSLNAISGGNYPAIGYTTPKIEFNNTYTYAETQSSSYPAIGDKTINCDTIIVNGTTITALGGINGLKADYIEINSGSVKGTLSGTAVNEEGDTVYCVTVPHNGQLSLQMNDGTKDSMLTFYAHHPGDDNFYIYLPNGKYTFTNGDGFNYTAEVDREDVVASIPAIDGDGIIDVSSGKAVSVYDTMYYIGSQPYTYSGNKFTFTGSITSTGITFQSKLADTIIFRNLDIDMEAGCAFSLQTGTDIVLMLEGTNKLTSTGANAGFEKDSTSGILTIIGPDTLIATGGIGIGNCWTSGSIGSGDIIITNGVILSTGTYTAIGGGPSVKAGEITIDGGIVSAVCLGSPYTGDVAIGNASGITINGGMVNISSGDNAPFSGSVKITGGVVSTVNSDVTSLPSGISISGGTVSVRNESSASTFTKGTFTGGSIKFLSGDDKTVVSSQPVNPDSIILYRSLYKVPKITIPTLIDSIIINDSVKWGCKDVYTDSVGMVYLWISESDTAIVKIAVSGKTYHYSGGVIAYNNYVAPDEEEGIIEYGNYLWQVPLNIAESEKGTIEVNSEGTTLYSRDYFCYKTELPLSITVTPTTGYLTDSITVYGSKTTGDTTITVVDTIKIAAAFSLQYFSVEYSSVGNGSLTVSDETGNLETGASVGYGTELSMTATAEEGYLFDSLVIGGIVSTATDTVITVTGSVSIGAYFSEATGINSITTENIWVYSREKTVFVHCSENAEISVYSISGTLVAKQQATSGSTAIPVEQSGIYILKITTENGKKGSLKCVVQ